MATTYKGIEYVSNPRERVVYYKNQTFDNTAEGVNSIQFRSESLDFSDASKLQTYTTSGSHYQFADNFLNNEAAFDGYTNMNRTKLYSSGSVIYIPQQYFGERIKAKSFTLTDDYNAKQIIIKDDGNGNLYSTNAHNSRSAATSLSSSDNYVGNIHYESGVVLLTETASWSGSGLHTTDINYSDVGRGTFKLDFNSTQTIYQNELILKVKAHEFNATGNQTIYRVGDNGSKSSAILPTISRSLDDWSPYATGIALYRERPSVLANRYIDTGWSDIPSQSLDSEDWYLGDDLVFYTPEVQPLMIAKFPKPIKIDRLTDVTIVIRYDT